ncbi:unnamed protein product [Ophioblennius macclurei]
MAEGFYKLEDEAFPSFLSRSLDSTSGRATLENVTLGSGPGLPVAASTVAKIKPQTDNRDPLEASYLEVKTTLQPSAGETPRFALSFKDDLDNADDFIAAHRLSDMLLKINPEESASRNNLSPTQSGLVCGRPTELATDLSTGLLTFAQFGQKDLTDTKALPPAEDDHLQSEGLDSDHYSGSNSSFLANEKLMCASMSSDVSDDDIDLNNLPDDELELYFNKLVPPAMQRGRVEGQEIPTGVPASDLSNSSSAEPEQHRHQFLDQYDQENFQMPDVRLAATGMDSCPASDEDTEDELESVRRSSSATRARLLPSTSRQLVGESNRPSFRPGLEGGSSDDEASGGRVAPLRSGIEHRRSAEGQVINSPVSGDGGGGDGSSGSEESGNDGGVSTIPLPPANVHMTTYDALRGLGIVGGDEDSDENSLLSLGRNNFSRHAEMGDRVGPVGTGEAGSSQRLSPVNWSMVLDRQEALDAMEGTDSSAVVDRLLDSVYLRNGAGLRKIQDATNATVSHLQGTQGSFHLSQVLLPDSDNEAEGDGVHDADGAEASDPTSEEENEVLSTSLEAKYFSQSFHAEQDDSDDAWNHCPDNMELEFEQGAKASQGVVYQNEEGQWVTDLAYYSSFEKELDGRAAEVTGHGQTEDFVPASDAMERLMKDQEEFEKEHQFMQEEQIQPAAAAATAADSSSCQSDTSWKVPAVGHVLMRASQVSSEFQQGDESYLRLSLGQFFSQRSEALGCLGRVEDAVKRPSFGYVITSPEKREPFALIHPSDFSCTDSSPLNVTVEVSEGDKTLQPEDLDKTLEAPGERMTPKGDLHPGSREQEENAVRAAPSQNGSVSESSVGGQSFTSPDINNSHLMLSISTIASAIADASISTDPSQLAAMIVELSKRSRVKSREHSGRSTASTTEEHIPSPQIFPDPDLSAALQKTTCIGELSAFDMEKYLRKTEISGCSDTSAAHTTFDLSGWAESLGKSQRDVQALDAENQSISAQPDSRDQRITTGGKTRETKGSLEGPHPNAPSPPNRTDGKRSSIPRPRASLRRSVGSSTASDNTASSSVGGTHTENGLKAQQTFETQHTTRTAAPSPRTSATTPGWNKGDSGPRVKPTSLEFSEAKPPTRSTTTAPRIQSLGNPGGVSSHSVKPTVDPASAFSAPCVEETQCSFRPSTSPLTHSSPSQTSIPSADGLLSPPSGIGAADSRPALDLSPRSPCSSPSLSRLTFISMNDGRGVPTPDKQKDNCTMALSTTIIRFSPTPPGESDAPPNLDAADQAQPQHSKSLDPLPGQTTKSPEPSRSSSALSECSCHRTGDASADCRSHKHASQPGARQLTKVDSGYSSNLNIQQAGSSAVPPSSQQWGAAGSLSSAAYAGSLGPPPSFSSEGLHYVPIPSFKTPCPGVMNLPQGNMQSLLIGSSLYNPQLARQYLGPEASLHSGSYHVGGNGLYPVVSSTVDPLGIGGPLSRPHQSQQDIGMLGKAFSQYGAEALVEELRGQVVVPEELCFPHACCVGIASQTTLSLFNPCDRWQQVSITVSNLTVDGEKVDSMHYQWLMVKNKTIIGPRSTEEQKVLLVPPHAGAYRCVLSVSSWPASAEPEMAARASIFAKRVVLVAIAENPAVEVEAGDSGCLDFGDLPGGGIRSLPLKLLNRTHATVPIRLVINATASAWRCFSFSKQPLTSETPLQAGHMNLVSAPSVINHVLHASYGESPDSFVVWVHFKAPHKYTASSEELGLADEFSARVDIEVDGPGPSHVIRSTPLRARSGTARVHAPKDLQTVSLSAPPGKSCQQTLPLKNAGNIDVQLKLKISDTENVFSVTPQELSLRVEDEQGIVVSFQGPTTQKHRESLLTILVLPCGPQYEVTLRGEVTTEASGGPAALSSAAAVSSSVPPILSNKQFVAWGGVTLGRAVQQKLVLRNNSTNTTQQLRLLIRGQDQDCFQLQSMFSPDERLTRHGELSIRPREDVTVHLLFAPTRVACMLAKLEIKQAGVRPSQPGVKFTIPLSGYGGTSNIILEDQRKQAEGYVATLADIAVGHVSKVCLCVRNTGSRAAFVKAVAFADIQNRAVMEASVISLAPSQFVLKERTQEVITVLMKSSLREQSLCQSPNPLLATVCLFCGDEVSRQQYRRLLQDKPDVAQKALSENSLLRNVDFSEKFLGEENVSETYDLPQRPNEAHVFYGNMSKVAVSLLGSRSGADGEGSEPSGRRSSETDSGSSNGNVSLDVLPVKGPQGPALRVAEPSLKPSEPLHGESESWIVHPEQLVLAAPTINDASITSQVQIRNNTSRELRFDLSWPAHCLTITPQHGVIEPQCHLQILISPNPSLATRSTLLPWSGQIYVQCDGQQKFIKVQIRQDLALDVSAAPTDQLSALPAQAATPVVQPVSRLAAGPPSTPQTTQPLMEISNKTVVFPSTRPGETSEAQLEVQNGNVEVRWYLSSFAPPYVKGVDDSGDVYRATYTAFRCSRVSGTLGAHQRLQVPIIFLPRDRGDYAQFWDLESHPVSEPQQKSRIRFQLCGTGAKCGSAEGPQEGDCSLVKTEASVKSRRRTDASPGKSSAEEAPRRGVYAPQDIYAFPATRVGESSSLKVNIRNNSADTHELKFVNPREPFHIKHSKYSLRSQHYLKLPVQFRPGTAGNHTGLLLIQSETSGSLVIQLTAEALP